MIDLIKKLIYFLYVVRGRIKMGKKISLIYKSLPSIKHISIWKINEHKSLWGKSGSKPNLKWYKVYASINGNDDPEYISEVDYYNRVELILNNRAFSEAYCDKNFYHKYIDNEVLPNIYIRNIQGVYYTANYQVINILNELNKYIPDASEKLIIKKAVDSGGGRGVELFTKSDTIWVNKQKDILTKSYLEKKFGMNFIVQEYIHQHNFYDMFNSSSVNTVRLVTYRSVRTNEIIPLQSVLRIGKPGSFVDNQAMGGIACGIDKNGKLGSFGVNKKGEKTFGVNGISFDHVGAVYKYNEIVNVGLSVAEKFYYHRILGFDFCVDKTGKILIIEVNNRNNEINFLQMNNGPLFGKYTSEVNDYCQKNKRTICFDFEI